MPEHSVIIVGSFTFRLKPSPDKPGETLFEIEREGRPLENLRGEPMRKTFPATKAARQHIERFCQRFATDDSYRTSIMVRDNFSCC